MTSKTDRFEPDKHEALKDEDSTDRHLNTYDTKIQSSESTKKSQGKAKNNIKKSKKLKTRKKNTHLSLLR